ncbi:hypothetical protein VC83_03294 [Pseudogymnoascus destructans]|uniref:Uncharacterized protein n=1 Tax=Pseudogymnoascus destructans TaxID=655981 RepID=A0A177AEN0_9PEZI|nr:uncharacterized protein VC83_03294 [Pseudogymnoascus destructans]OAF60565.1 hypothetical protein VC83_03294 [Pseudogymnoascus destructans]
MTFPYKHVLLIGATSGIGKAMVERLIAEGVKVTGVGRRKDALEEFENAHPGLARGAALDITQLESFLGLQNSKIGPVAITEAPPDIDCLFLNEGMQRPFNFSKPETVDLNVFHAETTVNYTSLVAVTHAFLPFLIVKEGPSGIILRVGLRNTHIKVTEIAAPPVKTDLHDYMGVEVGRNLGMPLDQFTEEAYQGLLSGDDTIAVGGIMIPGAKEAMADIAAVIWAFRLVVGAVG